MPSPAVIATEPAVPLVPVTSPAVTETSPPPATPEPTDIAISPPLPTDEEPVCREIDPESAPEVTPVDIVTLPLRPSLTALEI